MTDKSKVTPNVPEVTVQRAKRAKPTAEEALKRMDAFPERKERIVAAVRKRGIGVSPC